MAIDQAWHTSRGWGSHLWTELHRDGWTKRERKNRTANVYKPFGMREHGDPEVHLDWAELDACKTLEEFIELYEIALAVDNVRG